MFSQHRFAKFAGTALVAGGGGLAARATAGTAGALSSTADTFRTEITAEGIGDDSPTDATKAPKGTIRGDLGTDLERNAVHGSDAPETARVEIAYVFNAAEIAGPVEALPG